MQTLFLNTLRLIRSPAYHDCLASIGITADDLILLRLPTLWAAVGQRARAVEIVNHLVRAASEANGVKESRVPAEAVATVIALFVAPANVPAACSGFEGVAYRKMDLARGSWEDMKPFHHEQLQAMVALVVESDYHGIASINPVLAALEEHLLRARMPGAQISPSSTVYPVSHKDLT